jgi:tryptophan synthase alpha chain
VTTGIERLRSAFRPDRPTLVAYVPIGDPEAFDARTLDAYRDAGVGVLEVGIPTADPWMDGAEVTDSMRRALAAGTTPGAAAAILGAWRAGHAAAGRATPAILWFSYPDLPLSAITAGAAAGGLDALLMLEPWRRPDAATVGAALDRAGVARSTFLPWDATERDLALARETTGYLMVQARPGVTGAGGPTADPTQRIRLARTLAPGQPVIGGFGVHDAASVRALAGSGVDGVVVGSACIAAAREGGPDGVRAYLRTLADALEPAP